MEGFWEDEEYKINSMYECNIPWVATRSMTVALEAMHESRAFYADRHYNRTYDANPYEHNPIGNWMKKIEMMRTAPVWGFCDDDDILYLVEKDIYNAGEDADLLVDASSIYDWDMDVSRCTEFDPSDPANIAAAEEEDDDYWHQQFQAEENDYDRFYVGRRLFDEDEDRANEARILDESFNDSLNDGFNVRRRLFADEGTKMLSFITDFNMPRWIV